MVSNAGVTLYYDDAPKLATTSTGVAITGGFASTDGSTITTADNSDNLTLTSTDADASSGPNLNMFRNSSSPADNDFLGNVKFNGRNDNSQDVQYGELEVYAADVSDGEEDGWLNFNVMTAGSNLSYLQIKGGTGVVFNEDSNDIDFRVESNGNANMLFVDGGNDRVGVGTNTPVTLLHLQGSEPDIFLRRTDLTNKAWRFNVQSSTGDLNIKSRNDDGSASTTSMVIAHDGYVTTPLQPAFYAETSSTQTDFGLSSTHTIAFGTERFDQGSDFASNVFTAPVTGKYFLNTTLRFESVDTAAVYYLWGFDTSNHDYLSIIYPSFVNDVAYITVNQTVLADMDAGDTAKVIFQQVGGTQQTDLQGAGGYSYFCGHLVA